MRWHSLFLLAAAVTSHHTSCRLVRQLSLVVACVFCNACAADTRLVQPIKQMFSAVVAGSTILGTVGLRLC